MPSIVPPQGHDDDLYFVLCDYGELGTAYVEIDPAHADRQSTIRMLAEGQFKNPVRIICVSLERGTAEDVTEEISKEAALMLRD